MGEMTQRERDHLVAIVDILQEISSSLHFVDILQTIARKMGEAFGLDRCAIFLSGAHNEVRLVASYEDPTIRNLVVDLDRYPELKRAFESGETVFIPDAVTDPSLKSIKATLDMRNVRSIIVVPIRWQGTVIGAIFLRTDRDAEPFSDADVRFCQVVASLTAKSLRNAHRFEALLRDQKDTAETQRKAELQRIALIAFVRRLLARYARSDEHVWAETLLPKASDEELERLVTVAMQVIDEESKA
jgi:two-component system sensor histidine kinase ChiS